MASLISPGVSVSIIDESQYQPTATGTVAYVLLATDQDKINPDGTVATYTTKANAGKLIKLTSQRELVAGFGSVNFQVDSSDNPIHAHELNEYGLLAAYSALGVSNQIYVQRADVNLSELAGTSIRPTGTASDGTYWLDVSASGTNWGITEWSEDTTGFTLQNPLVITDTAQLSGSVPLASVGTIGSYAVNTTTTSNPVYFKRYDNTWVLVGSDAWKTAIPTVVGTVSNPTTLTTSQKMVINGVNVSMTSTTVTQAAADIAGASIPGVTATVNSVGQLEIRANSLARSNGVTADGKLTIAKGTTISVPAPDCAANLGIISSNVSVTSVTLNGPTITFDTYRNAPAWRTSDVTPRPAGSVWFKTSATGNGANWGIKKYNALLESWELQAAPLYASDTDAINGLDLVGGGGQLGVGTLYVKYDTLGATTATFKPYVKNVTGIVKITGTTAGGSFTYDANDAFIMEVSVPGSTLTESATINLSSTTATSLVADILAAGLTNIAAAIETSGAVSISHLAGGTIKFTQTSGTPLLDAGLTTAANMQTITAGSVYLASPFTPLTYTYSTTAPYSNPADGTLWYYNSAIEVDIMVNDGSGWVGYQNLANDARGYDLTATDPLGPILAASKPTTQVSGAQLQPGDLWIDTSDLENYPVIYRYTDVAGVWELIDNTDQVSADGILFADARWGVDGTEDPIVDTIPSIVDLASSDYIDSDCPDYQLYPRGTLLFNTRRSGYGVKRFESTYFADDLNPPAEVGTWVSNSGVDQNLVPYFGHKAVRNVIVEAMKSAIESSTALREEQVQFNLICAPGYPELITNMITLNNDRKQTAFIIGDSPLTLNSASTQIEAWASNQNLAADNGINGLVSTSEYVGVFYPSGLGTDLGGESVVVPPSHMMLRTMIRSDNVSYPWFAPAGVRRGLIDNVSSIGYVDTTDGNAFRSIGVTAGLRDVLYAQKVNPLTVLPGVGLVNYGQKTRAASTSAMDRINVARLVCYLRKVLDEVARPFIFEPNDTITRNQVKQAFESVLNDVVAKRGIYDYLVVCDTTNNTPDRIDRNELYIDIAIEPVKAIEFIYIPVRLKNTGAIAAGL
jgi:hypothetical protein